MHIPFVGFPQRQSIVNCILLSMVFEISPGSRIYRDWQYIICNSVERNCTPRMQVMGGSHINYFLILHR